MVTTEQKPIVKTQRIKRKNYNHTTKEKVNKSQRKRARKEERNRATMKTAREKLVRWQEARTDKTLFYM